MVRRNCRNLCSRRRIVCGRQLINLILRVDWETRKRAALERCPRKRRNHIAVHIGDRIVSEAVCPIHSHTAGAVRCNFSICIWHRKHAVIRCANALENYCVSLTATNHCRCDGHCADAAGPRPCNIVGSRRRSRLENIRPGGRIPVVRSVLCEFANFYSRIAAQRTVCAVRKVQRVPLVRIFNKLRINFYGSRRTRACRNHKLLICSRNHRAVGRRVVNLCLGTVHLHIPAFQHVVRIRIRMYQ